MIDATVFCYGSHQITAAYDRHICTDGVPDVETEFLARERENGTPSSGYRPAFYVPGKAHLVVITDQCFRQEGHAKAWIADQIRMSVIARKRQGENN